MLLLQNILFYFEFTNISIILSGVLKKLLKLHSDLFDISMSQYKIPIVNSSFCYISFIIRYIRYTRGLIKIVIIDIKFFYNSIDYIETYIDSCINF
jgi:hypothetical protein